MRYVRSRPDQSGIQPLSVSLKILWRSSRRRRPRRRREKFWRFYLFFYRKTAKNSPRRRREAIKWIVKVWNPDLEFHTGHCPMCMSGKYSIFDAPGARAGSRRRLVRRRREIFAISPSKTAIYSIYFTRMGAPATSQTHSVHSALGRAHTHTHTQASAKYS